MEWGLAFWPCLHRNIQTSKMAADCSPWLATLWPVCHFLMAETQYPRPHLKDSFALAPF